MSIKYSILKGTFHILPVQRMMAKPYDELIKMFKTTKAKLRGREIFACKFTS